MVNYNHRGFADFDIHWNTYRRATITDIQLRKTEFVNSNQEKWNNGHNNCDCM